MRDLGPREKLRRQRDAPGPIPTLAQARQETTWCWVWCESCHHHAPIALVPLIIRWGPEASTDLLRRRARCTKCGALGASLLHPSYVDDLVGLQPFPVEEARKLIIAAEPLASNVLPGNCAASAHPPA